MADTTVPVILPNPYTPLAFFPPTIADQFELSTYVIVAGLSVFVWDWLVSISDEYKFLRSSRFGVTNAVYLLSRSSTLAYCITTTLFETRNIAHCRALMFSIAAALILAGSTTSLLFFFRVRAIWSNSKIITVFFGMLWLANLGVSFLLLLALDGAHIGPTQRCIVTAVRPYASISILLDAINDTLIFIAISVRVVEFTYAGDTWRAQLRSFANGEGLPRLSKGLLQSGQLYYFTCIGMSIASATVVLCASVPPSYQAMFSVMNMAIVNAMACRVFRAIKLGFINDDASSYNRNNTIPIGRLQFRADALTTVSFDRSRTTQGNVEITKTTHIVQSMPDENASDEPKDASDQV